MVAMTGNNAQAPLVPLGEGVYTVRQVCRILQPSMTSRKVHYWLDTGLLTPSTLRRSGRGRVTLLTFRQLLEIRTAQHMRDDLRVSLPVVREAFAWVLSTLFAESISHVTFERGRGGRVVATAGNGQSVEIPTGQLAIPKLTNLNTTMAVTKKAWVERSFSIPGQPGVVAKADVLGGAPTIRGTRIETSLVASFAQAGWDDQVVTDVLDSYPMLELGDVVAALEFEGVKRAA